MKTHEIHWVSAVNGKHGVGTKQFEKEESERLGAELNESYPEMIMRRFCLCRPPLDLQLSLLQLKFPTRGTDLLFSR